MKGYLLDTNLVVALLWTSHEKHDVAKKWFLRRRRSGWATCPITESGFVRIVSNPAFSRDAVSPREAASVLAANTASEDHVFWEDSLPFHQAIAFSGARLVGHQQVTDSYLLGLAQKRGGILATLDSRIGALIEPHSAVRKALEIVS
ncbi:MAG TPA: TA system VapC family ribonuclease toxin [Terriglobia bacterium]|nr:TA system VapC family ribonuclease toxin [Terriglobia bacterium]